MELALELTLRLETDNARYACVTRPCFMARGRLIGGGVMYEVYRTT